MLRLSSYLILSDRLKNGGYAVLCGLSGAIELVSEDLYQILKTKTSSGNPHMLYIEENDLPPDIIETFLKRGHITKISHEEERDLLKEVASIMHEQAVKQPSVVIVPNLDCNYRCVYCFEKHMQSGLKTRKTKMTLSDVDAVYQAIDMLASEVGSIAEKITLFGGEPLCADNKKVVQYIVERGLKGGHSFFAVTNGHDIDEFIEFLGKDKITGLQITVDGPESVHNKRRIPIDGSSSFAKVMVNIRRAIAETDVMISLRINLDENNYQAINELLSIFEKEGWLKNPRISIATAVIDIKNKKGNIVPALDLNKVRSIMSDVTKQYVNVEIGSQQSAEGYRAVSALSSNTPYSLRSSYCAATSGMYIFLPDGTISSCWDSLGEECSRIGTYSEKGLSLDKPKMAHRFNRSAAKIPACLDCKYCLVCAGGCAQHAEYNSHDIYQPCCDNFPNIYPWALADAVEKYLKALHL